MSNEPVWTDWLENPGTGACPVPEWHRGYFTREADKKPSNGEFGVGPAGYNPAMRRWRKVKYYRYAVPADLAYIAKHAKPADFNGSIPVSAFALGNGEYQLDDYLRARRDLGYDEPANVATPEEEAEYWGQDEQQAPSKYHRNIKGVYVDVYDIIHAYGITNPGDQHAIKKMLKPGKRGYKDARQDREEAIASLRRANELEGKK